MHSLLFVAAASLLAQESEPFIHPEQIAWVRNIEDARALSTAENRPMLVAINVDGESASDRIVEERYRDPDFVAWTRRFVCVVGHPLRHSPRDHDESGRRLSCPRLGSVTCGEHMALEPLLFDAYLGGDRVSPRHALILPDGTKSFDLFLLFDMEELDTALEKSAVDAPPDSTANAWFSVHDEPNVFYDQLAGARASWQREMFETFAGDPETRGLALDLVRAIGRVGNAGSVEALRVILQAAPPSRELLDAALEAAQTRGFERELGWFAFQLQNSAGPHPGSPTLGDDRAFLPLLARTIGQDRPVRFALGSYAAMGDERDRVSARASLALAVSPEETTRIEAAIEDAGGPVEIADLLRLGLEMSREPTPPSTIPVEPMRTQDELVDELTAAERGLTGHESDPDAAKRFGLANLALARARIESSGPDIGLLLQDADSWLERAARVSPDDALLALERSRTAYYLTRFEDQARIAGELLARSKPRRPTLESALRAVSRFDAWGSGTASGRAEVERAVPLVSDEISCEALRWIADAHARLLGQSIDDRPLEALTAVRASRPMATVCASVFAKDTDFQGLATYLRASGLTRSCLATVRTGLERFPESNILRDLLRDVLVAHGRPDILVETADWLAGLHPESAACAWYAGYARVLSAEWARRGERADGAIRDYDEATRLFTTSIRLEPAFGDSAGHYLAMSELGRGFAHRLAGRKQDAADCLARAIAIRPAIGDARDGLDREALDLVDAVLEWTEAGSSPVNTIAFADALSRAVPAEARWLRAIADTALREGLRADGRSTRKMRIPAAFRVPGDPEETEEPTELGDRWFGESIEIAARARALSDDPTSRQYEAQSRTLHAERLLVRGRESEAWPLLVEAARLLEEPAQTGETAIDVALRLRARLGDARPVPRPGR